MKLIKRNLIKIFVELDALTTYLQSAPTALILIEGHTDNRGDSVQNELLSLKRANTIATYLISKGIESNRIKTIGLGGTKPISDNATEEGRIKIDALALLLAFRNLRFNR